MPIIRNEGPFILILLPSHELALQTFEIANDYFIKLKEKGYPLLKAMLCIGGMDM